MKLPTSDDKSSGAKGSLQLRNGASVRYISMASIRIKDGRTGARSIAHFYRNMEVWPSYDPSRILAPTPSALYSTAAKPVFMGGPGKLKLTASLHREIWIAGQRCYAKVFVANDTTKKVKTMALTLIRAETIFRLNPALDATSPTSKSTGLDADACHTSTTRKIVAETTLEMASKGTSGYATAKGWWTGVEAGGSLEFVHYILLPVSFRYHVCLLLLMTPNFKPDAISVTRSRLLEVSYFVRITVGAGSLSSEVSVQLPIRVINFLSIDPIPSFAPSQAVLPPKRHTESVETSERRSRSMDDVRGIRLARTMFESRGIAPGVGIIALDGTYRGDATLHPIGRLEVRNFTPPEALMRRAAEQRLQELVFDPGLDADASEESRYLHDWVTVKPVVVDGGQRQDDTVELQRVSHAREPQVHDSVARTPSCGGSSIEDSLQQNSPELEPGAIPLTAYSSTATQRMYNVSQETSPRRPVPKPSASAYPTSQHPTSRVSLSPGDIIDADITSDEEAGFLPDSTNSDDGSIVGALQDSGVEVDREETPDGRPNVRVSFQEELLRRRPALSRGPSEVPPLVEAISNPTSHSRPWQMGSRPLPTRMRQRSSVSTVASSMQSSRATSMAGGVDSRSSGSYSSHDSVPVPRIGGAKPVQGRPNCGTPTPVGRKYPMPNDGGAGTRTSRNIVKGGLMGVVLQPRPLPTSRTTARRSMVEGGLRTGMRTTIELKSPPPASVPRPIPQPVRSSAITSPSKEPAVSCSSATDLQRKGDSTEPHPCDKLDLGEDAAPSAPQTFHQPNTSDDPNYIPPTVSALMRTEIQPGNISASILRGPRPPPERQPSRQLKDEELLEGTSQPAPSFTKKWENNGHLTYLQQLDTTPTATNRAHQSMTSTPSKAFGPGPTSVKSRIAMLEEKNKSLDNTSGTMIGGRWSATSGISSGRSSVRPLSNSSAVTSESGISTYRESGRVRDSRRDHEGAGEGMTGSTRK